MIRKDKHVQIIRDKLVTVSQDFIRRGSSLESLKVVAHSEDYDQCEKRTTPYTNKIFFIFFILPVCLVTIVVKFSTVDRIIKYAYGTRCVIPNNYLVWEFTRPVSDCHYCRDVTSALILPDKTTKTQFEHYAYSSRPIIVKNAAGHWPAANIFDLKFFRNLYETVEGAYETIDEECQFLHFKSNFGKLREVFEMNDRRAMNLEGEQAWYVGWKNCHPQILERMKEFYEPPTFLPDDAEIPSTNYIFLGYDQGAIMHLDYIPRLMWQGQIHGSKTWTVAPTPECEHVCKHFDFSVATGDVVLIDTRLWYHGTYVDNGTFSLTVTSEYG